MTGLEAVCAAGLLAVCGILLVSQLALAYKVRALDLAAGKALREHRVLIDQLQGAPKRRKGGK